MQSKSQIVHTVVPSGDNSSQNQRDAGEIKSVLDSVFYNTSVSFGDGNTGESADDSPITPFTSAAV